MRDQIQNAFSTCRTNCCLSVSTATIIEVFEPKVAKCYISEGHDSNSNFSILNPNFKEISFLAIDKCVFLDSDPLKRCDFAIFDLGTFCFVEIKDTLNRSSSHKDKSSEQLISTINEFLCKLSFEGYVLEAIISWRYRPKRPLASTNMQSKKIFFHTTFNARLFEGNQKTF